MPHRFVTCALVAVLSCVYIWGTMLTGAVRWDGLGPAPYRYVSPPPGVENPGTPSSVTKQVRLTPAGSAPDQIFTADLQAQLLLATGVFAGDQGEIQVSLTPKALPPQSGKVVLVGNVYELTATFANGKPVPEPWKGKAQLYLRFPESVTPGSLYRLEAGQPVQVPGSTVEEGSGLVVSPIDRGGQYVVAGEMHNGGTGVTAASTSFTRTLLAAAAAGVLVVILVAAGIVMRSRRQGGRPTGRGR